MNSFISNAFENATTELETAEVSSKQPTSIRNTYLMVSIYDMHPHSKNRDINMEAVKELAANIRLNGIQQAPVLKPDGNGQFTILAGCHRWKACGINVEQFGLKQFERIQCMIQYKDDIDSELILIDTNIKVNPLSAFDMMMAIGRKEELLRMKKENNELSGNIKAIIEEQSTLKRTQIGTYISIYKKGSEAVKEALKNELITLAQASKLSKLSIENQITELNKIVKKGSSDDQKLKYKKYLTKLRNSTNEITKFLHGIPVDDLTEKQKDLLRLSNQMVEYLDIVDEELRCNDEI